MAAVSRSRRGIAGIVFIVAGALLALAVILPLLGVGGAPWLVGLAFAAIAVAFAILGFGAVNSTLAKVALIAAAIGWILLAINAIGVALPGVLVTIAALVAGIAGLIGAIVLYVGKEVRNTPALVFIATTVLGLLYLLGVLGTIAFGTLGTVIAILFAAGLIITGVLFYQRENGRRG
ncbi:MAG TPA: hypothetical protein VGO65_02775 [Pseudolysinimonas sp.]|jgi:hypothetical protein|nr:hypothetical protein [Pseudolysinimonas sp.]